MYNSWIEKYDEIVEHRTDEEQLIKKQPVIAREYVEKNYIHKDKIKEKIKELEEKSEYWNCDEMQVLKELLEKDK